MALKLPTQLGDEPDFHWVVLVHNFFSQNKTRYAARRIRFVIKRI